MEDRSPSFAMGWQIVRSRAAATAATAIAFVFALSFTMGDFSCRTFGLTGAAPLAFRRQTERASRAQCSPRVSASFG